jgi:hypothetical protein
MSKFEAACYDDKGEMTMSETDKNQLMADKDKLMQEKVQLMADKDKDANTIKGLETVKVQLEAQLGSAQKAASDENTPTWAIAIIVVIGAMFLLVLVSLGILVSR